MIKLSYHPAMRFMLAGVIALLLALSSPKNITSQGTLAKSLTQATQFLHPPYPGTAAETSIFDHDPTISADPNTWRILAFTGDEANYICPGGTIPPQGTDGVYCFMLGADTTYWSFTLNNGAGDWLAYDNHDGIDYYFYDDYRPIFAAADAERAVRAGWENPKNHQQGFGLRVRLHHANGYETLYGHLSAIAVQACSTNCVPIAQGNIIGISGSTGQSTANHLHFGVYDSSSNTIPRRWRHGR